MASFRTGLLLPALAGVLLALLFTAAPVEGRSRGKDMYYFLSAYLNRNGEELHKRCGKQQIGDWTLDSEFYALENGTRVFPPITPPVFYPSNGIFRAPVGGFYHICYAFRISKGSNADFAIYEKNSNLNTTQIMAAFGSQATFSSDWTHQQKCVNLRIAKDNTVWVQLESGAETDCIEDTSWRYGRLDVFLYGPTSAQITPDAK